MPAQCSRTKSTLRAVRLRRYVSEAGGAEKVLHFGSKQTKRIYVDRTDRAAADNGVRYRNESSHNPGIHPRTTWKLMGNLRGRNQCGLVVRLTEAARGPAGGMRSAEECRRLGAGTQTQ